MNHNSVLDTAKVELERRVKRDIREDGDITADAVDHHVTMVARSFEVSESLLRIVARKALAKAAA